MKNIDKNTATITSCKGDAFGKPKFHIITNINQRIQLIFLIIYFTTLFVTVFSLLNIIKKI
jgi:hypothetical protein